MSIVAFIGDCTTTTAMAVAASWPAEEPPVIVEADPTGGSLAAWLDTPATPSLSTIVANSRKSTLDGAPAQKNQPGHGIRHAVSGTIASAAESGQVEQVPFAAMIQQSRSGTRFVAAPVRGREAHRVLIEASTTVFPAMAAAQHTTWLADLGHYSPATRPACLAELADTIVVGHRQATASAAAAGVRLERTVEIVDRLAVLGVPMVLAIIGTRPFDVGEIEQFVSDDGRHEVTARPVADDPFGAAVLAGRTGVSVRRLARLPLLRSARAIAALLATIDPFDGSAPIDHPDEAVNETAATTAGDRRSAEGVRV